MVIKIDQIQTLNQNNKKNREDQIVLIDQI